MSAELLSFMNGNRRGVFRKYLDSLQDEPAIAWYPSAGTDFRALLYLSPQYSAMNPADQQEPEHPQLFLFTDYFPWSDSKFLDDSVVHDDGRTRIVVNYIEELPDLDLPLDPDIVAFPEGSAATGRVLYLEVLVKSDMLGEFTYPVIYAFVENEALCSKVLLKKNSQISHVIHIRYGSGFGGSKASGAWILNTLKQLRCNILVSDGHHSEHSGDKAAYIKYPNLMGERAQLKEIRRIDGAGWSDHGDVTWNLVE